MTTAMPALWTDAPEVPADAAPIRAVDSWRAERTGDKLIVTARTRVRGDDPNLRGHFPGLPIFPGVFVIEALCQAMGLAATATRLPPQDLRVLRSVRFLAPLLDGDELTIGITASPLPGGGWDTTAEGRRGDGTITARIRAEFGPDLPAPAQREAPPPAAPPGPAVREHHHVRETLPQRHPLLLVDRVLEFEPGKSITCIKAITGTEPSYAALRDGAGSSSHRYPRSLMIESFGQSAALLWLDGRLPAPGGDRVLMFVGARDFRFEGHAEPGDVLRHRVRLESVVADTAFATGETWVGDRRIAVVSSLMATRRPLLISPHAHHAERSRKDHDDAESAA